MTKLTFLLILLLCSLPYTYTKADCAPDLSSVGDSVVTLSDELSDAYTAEERCEELGGYLVDTREAEVNQTVTEAAKLKYPKNIQRVWIYYNEDQTNLYKYTKSSNQASPWVSPQHLGHLWYLDLYTSSSPGVFIPIYFCKSGNKKWSVRAQTTCNGDGWMEDFVLHGLASSEAGYKAIYVYDQAKEPWSMRLTEVEDDNYNEFNNLKGTFYAPVTDVFIGAQFNTTSNKWQWSDGEIAGEFENTTHGSCQQKIWSDFADQELNTNCNQTQAYYSCQLKLTFNVSNIECNSAALEVSWNLLPLAIKYTRTLTVSVKAMLDSSVQSSCEVVDKKSTILGGLNPGKSYSILVTANLDCDDLSALSSSQVVEMGPGSPNDVTYGHVIKSDDKCLVHFANPLPKGSFKVLISVHDETGSPNDILEFSEGCVQEMCEIAIPLITYTGWGKLSFEISASNCEGHTVSKPVAGNCFAPEPKVACRPSLTSKGEKVSTLSNDMVGVVDAKNACEQLKGALDVANEADMPEGLFPILNEKYLSDIQRVWIYRLKSDDQIFKYTFSDTTDENWQAPTGNNHLTYLDLFNRHSEEGDLIYFCNYDGALEKWKVETTECNQNGWKSRFSLYGKLTQASGYRIVYMFRSTQTNSTKLKSDNRVETNFDEIGEFFIPDINVRFGEIATRDNTVLCPILHYGNSWEISPNCPDTKTFYACTAPVILHNKHIPCNSSSMEIAWDGNLLNLSTLVPDLSLRVNIVTDDIEPSSVDFERLGVNITDLLPRINYTSTVTISSNEGCSGLSLEKTIQYETGFGTPDDVTSAYVTTSAGELFINVPEFVDKPYYDDRVYKVLSTNGYEDEFKAKPGGMQRFRINPNHIRTKEPMNFTIKCSTCEGESMEKNVAGSYFVPIDDKICSTTLIANGDRILTLSDERQEISALNEACGLLGGTLANITADERNNVLVPNLNVKYLQDVQRVWIYGNDTSFTYSLQPLPDLTSESSLEYIDMFREEILQTVTFCDPIDELVDKWQVGTSSCGKDESSLNITYHEYKLPSSDYYAEVRMNISTEYHGNNERINFTIRAVTCEGSNEWELVEGYCTSAQPISPPTSVGAIVGIIFGVLAAIALCAGGFVYYRRNSNLTPKEESNAAELDISDSIYQVGNIPEVSMSLKELLFGSYLSNSENEFSEFRDDFNKVKEESAKTQASNEVSKRRENALKNRYINILPMDHARVKLIGNIENDYINASYIPGYKSPRKFIAAQGPRPTTIDDFWMMIWENSSPIVVMLTGLKESGKTKCEQYWPEVGSSTTFGKYRINTLEENVFGAIIQRKFKVSTLGEQRIVIQLHYIGWPDHGTPITTTSLIRLRKMVEESHNRRNPIVVHCSAGVGRTGTYIAMDVLFDEADINGKVNVKECVLKMRENRSEMVQNWKQYALINKLVLEYVSLPDSDRNVSKLQRMSKAQLNQLARNEIATLNKWRFGDVWITGQNDLTSYKSNTVKIWSDKLQDTVELNASYVEDLMFGGKFIASQCPIEDNEEEFWQMLLVRRAHVVVCLDETVSFQFRSATKQFSDITLDSGNFYKEGALTVNNVAVQSGRQESFEVCVIQADSWKNKPPTSSDLFKLISKMQEIKARKQGEYVVVCCKNGCDKTGTFIALVNILERLKSQNRVDVFRTIKDLRDMRPNMVDNLELYNYCYSVVLDYLSLFNAYDNFNFKAETGVKIALEETNDPVYCNVSIANASYKSST